MSDTNGTTATEGTTAATEGTTNRVEGKAKGKTGPKRGGKETKFAKLYNLTRRIEGKGGLNGFVETEEGKTAVKVGGFPASLTDEGLTEEAANEGLSVSIPIGARELMGVKLKNGTKKFEGAEAVEYLIGLQELAEEFAD